MKLKFGMIGGGNGAFIGDVHRHGAIFDDLATLVCGCFTRNSENNLETGLKWGVDPERIYSNYIELAEKESMRDDGIDFIIIATPNNTHYEIAKKFLEHDIHVMCDKPLALNSEQGIELKKLAEEKNLLFGVTYTYAHYPIIEQARQMIQNGEIGTVRTVLAEYPQDWLAIALDCGKSEQSQWRHNPEISGASGCTADIGTHIEYVVSAMTDLHPTRVLCRMRHIPEELPLESETQILLDFNNGAQGMFYASQVHVGRDCSIMVRIVGDKGSIEWEYDNFSEIRVARLGQPAQIYSAQHNYLYDSCRAYSRIPSGSWEGFYEAFANIYRGFCLHLIEKKKGSNLVPYRYSTVDDGIQGLKFVEACLESNQNGSTWVDVK